MTVSEIIKKLWQIDFPERTEFLPGLIKKVLTHQVYVEKVKETAMNCYMEDMYIGLLMQDNEKTLDEFCEVWEFQEIVQYLTNREEQSRDD